MAKNEIYKGVLTVSSAVIGSVQIDNAGSMIGISDLTSDEISADEINAGEVVSDSVVVDEGQFGSDTNAVILDETGIELSGTAKYIENVPVSFNHSVVTGTGKPTIVSRGANQGFSLPVYDSDDEEVFGCVLIPMSWDGETDFSVKVGCWLPSANNAKNFNLQLSYSLTDFSGNDVVSDSTEDVPIETTTGDDAAHTSHLVTFPLTDSAASAVAGGTMSIRIRRLAASEEEIAGEVVIEGACVSITKNKLGAAI